MQQNAGDTGTPLGFVRGEVGEARRKVISRLGHEFARKSSDALLARLGADSGMETPSLPLILECVDYPLDPAIKASIDSVKDHRIRRQIHIPHARDACYARFGPVQAAMEKGGAQVHSCWLIAAMRVRGNPLACAEVAGDASVRFLDLPRALQLEMTVAGPAIEAPGFRTRFGTTGLGVRVAVIDGEVEVGHPALAGRAFAQANFTNEGLGNPSMHATAVAGIIAAADATLSGIAPEATTLNYKLFPTDDPGGSDDFDAAMAIERALADGAHIANCSWGAGSAGDGTSREARAFDAAWNLGLIIVKSAGNLGPGEGTLTSPADAEGVIVVAATDRRGSGLQDYSSRGPSLNGRHPHLSAPGGAPGDGIVTCLAGGATEFGRITHGTSFACAIVSGAAAVLLEKMPQATPSQIRDRLVAACRELPLAGANAQGAGMLHFAALSLAEEAAAGQPG